MKMSQKEHDAVVVKRLHQILKNADLEKTTVKNIQKQLESDLQITLSDRKQFIRDEVRVEYSPSSRSSRRARTVSAARPRRARVGSSPRDVNLFMARTAPSPRDFRMLTFSAPPRARPVHAQVEKYLKNGPGKKIGCVMTR